MQNYLTKYLFGIVGGCLVMFEQTIPYIIICLFAICLDCFTAYSLSRRLQKKYPGSTDGKFKSEYAKRKFKSILEIGNVIILLWLLDHVIFKMFDGLYLPNFGAGMFCFVELISILENISTASDATWAKLLQRVLASKAERHISPEFIHLLNNTQPSTPPDNGTAPNP